jgi:hypothetical protein
MNNPDMRRVPVRTIRGRTIMADELRCIQCRHRGFRIYKFVGVDHPHIECLGCGEKYCFGGAVCGGNEGDAQHDA